MSQTINKDELKKTIVFNVKSIYRKTIDEAINTIAGIGAGRYDLPYDIDGAVVKLNDLSGRVRM